MNLRQILKHKILRYAVITAVILIFIIWVMPWLYPQLTATYRYRVLESNNLIDLENKLNSKTYEGYVVDKMSTHVIGSTVYYTVILRRRALTKQ